MTIVRTSVLVIGAGMSGLAQAAALARSGIDFLVLEKADDLGGTWRDNTYPGASCDVESHLYSYSFSPNPSWSSTYAGQPEILEYLRGIATGRGLLSRIRFGVRVTGAQWDEAAHEWNLSTADGTQYVGSFLVLGIGGLHSPRVPEFPGAATFLGESWHSAQWNHDVDLSYKHVTLVGLGASGVQLAPYLAERAASLTVFQRTAPWVLPKADVPIPRWRQRLFRWLPVAQRLHRLRIYLRREKRGIGFHHRPDALRVAEPVVRQQIDKHIDDPRLRATLVPDYRFGCKRVLFSNDYYPALNQPHVHVVTGSPAAVRPDAVVDQTGQAHRCDVIVYATGFDLAGSFSAIDIQGVGGERLRDRWATTGMRAYNGIAVAGFPNMFILLGPNGVVSYTGVVSLIEAQARFVVGAIRRTRSSGAAALVVRRDAEERFEGEVRQMFERTVWHTGGCRSWYQTDSASGTLLWPDSTVRYRWRLRRLNKDDFVFLRASAADPSSVSESTAGIAG